MENEEGTKNVRIPHILRTLANFLVFLDFDFFFKKIEYIWRVLNGSPKNSKWKFTKKSASGLDLHIVTNYTFFSTNSLCNTI